MTCNNDEKTILSKELLHHYKKHNVPDIESYLKSNKGKMQTSSSRFIRLNPRYDQSETLILLQNELNGVVPIKIPWLDDSLCFYSVPGNYSLKSSPLFTSGRIYGMDVSSGAAVQALLFLDVDGKSQMDDFAASDNFRVLDLCCAPGLKTCAIADILEQCQEAARMEIVGVDVNPSRLHLCKNIIKKYHIDTDTSGRSIHDAYNLSISLFCADGTTFGTRASLRKNVDSLTFESTVAREETIIAGKRKRMNKSAKSRERKRLRTLGKDMFHTTYLPNTNESSELCSGSSFNGNHDDEIVITKFDRVLVDAECSTDGAVRHLQEKVGKSQFSETKDCQITNTKLTNSKQLDDLVDLQKRLIMSGFRLLKSGGIMVYSTCSLAREQNEDVVKWLLDECENRCDLLPVNFKCARNGVDEKNDSMISPGFDNIGARFHPSIGNGNVIYGGGFFLAKLKKLVL